MVTARKGNTSRQTDHAISMNLLLSERTPRGSEPIAALTPVAPDPDDSRRIDNTSPHVGNPPAWNPPPPPATTPTPTISPSRRGWQLSATRPAWPARRGSGA